MALIQSPCGLIEYFQATLSATANNVTGDNTFYRVAFDNIAFDTASGYNAGTFIYTAQRSGVYLITCEIGLAEVTDPLYTHFLLDITAGTNQGEAYGNPYVQANGSGQLGLTQAQAFYLTLGQTIDVEIMVNNGPKTVDVAGGSALSICLIKEFG